MADNPDRNISRREALRNVGLAGAAVMLPVIPAPPPAPQPHQAPPHPTPVAATPAASASAAPRAIPLHNLTVEEAEILDAILGRLIPADELGPGAREAGALRYIDHELGGALSQWRDAYRTGLAAIDRYSRYSRGTRFIELSPADQDRVLLDVQTGGATNAGAGFNGNSGVFFNLVRSHTLEATFGDPSYGGNAEFIGWTLIGYPGVRMGVTAETQRRLEAGELEPTYQSAYDIGVFQFRQGET